jgi:hypothetical protein
MKLFSKPIARLGPKHAMWPILCWLPSSGRPSCIRHFGEQPFLTVLAGFGLGYIARFQIIDSPPPGDQGSLALT